MGFAHCFGLISDNITVYTSHLHTEPRTITFTMEKENQKKWGGTIICICYLNQTFIHVNTFALSA